MDDSGFGFLSPLATTKAAGGGRRLFVIDVAAAIGTGSCSLARRGKRPSFGNRGSPQWYSYSQPSTDRCFSRRDTSSLTADYIPTRLPYRQDGVLIGVHGTARPSHFYCSGQHCINGILSNSNIRID